MGKMAILSFVLEIVCMETTFINPFMLFTPLTLFHSPNNFISLELERGFQISEQDISNVFQICSIIIQKSKSFGIVNISLSFFLNPDQPRCTKKKKGQNISSKE